MTHSPPQATLTPGTMGRSDQDRDDVAILGLGTALPSHVVTRSDVRPLIRSLFADRMGDLARLEQVFDSAGIETRHLCAPLDWYSHPHGWVERMVRYDTSALSLLEHAAERALRQAGLSADHIDTVVTLSSTGISTPTLEARLIERLGFRPDINRVPVFGLGCAGGVSGLAIGSRLARAAPGGTVLVLVVETCSLTFRANEATKANLVASALFGDGAAAVVLSTDARHGHGETGTDDASGLIPWLGLGSEHTFPDSLGIMGWRVEDDGLGVIFDRSIPDLVNRELGPLLTRHWGKTGRAAADPGQIGLVCHPGGRKVLEAYEAVLGGTEGIFQAERDVLARCGNMSAATVLFVLEELLNRGTLTGPQTLMALGPGFTCSLLDMHMRPSA